MTPRAALLWILRIVLYIAAIMALTYCSGVTDR